MITHEIFMLHRIVIWGLRSARIKKLKIRNPHFLKKAEKIDMKVANTNKQFITVKFNDVDISSLKLTL